MVVTSVASQALSRAIRPHCKGLNRSQYVMLRVAPACYKCLIKTAKVETIFNIL